VPAVFGCRVAAVKKARKFFAGVLLFGFAALPA
jgi:hypothetical protein